MSDLGRIFEGLEKLDSLKGEAIELPVLKVYIMRYRELADAQGMNVEPYIGELMTKIVKGLSVKQAIGIIESKIKEIKETKDQSNTVPLSIYKLDMKCPYVAMGDGSQAIVYARLFNRSDAILRALTLKVYSEKGVLAKEFAFRDRMINPYDMLEQTFILSPGTYKLRFTYRPPTYEKVTANEVECSIEVKGIIDTHRRLLGIPLTVHLEDQVLSDLHKKIKLQGKRRTYLLDKLIYKGNNVVLAGKSEGAEPFETAVKINHNVFDALSSGLDMKTVGNAEIKRFETEITRIDSKLENIAHPHILRFLDYQELYMAVFWELCKKGSLRYQLQRRGKLPVKEVLLLGVQLCSALRSLHDNGVIHGDIKPENVLFDQKQIAKLADFGTAASVLTRETTFVTPQYAAPEVLRKGELTEKGDVYSLGLTLAEAMIAYTPKTDGKHEMEEALIEDPDVPEGVKKVIRLALSEDLRKRISLKDLEAELYKEYHKLSDFI